MTDKKKELFGIPEISDPTLIDVMNAFHKLNSQLEGVEGSLAVAVDAVRGLGAEVIKSNEEVLARLEIQGTDFHIIKDAIVYGLANLGKSSEQPTYDKETAPAKTRDVTYGDSGIEWRDGKFGQWTFTMNQDGSARQNVVDLVKAINEAGGKLSASGYIYSLSKPDVVDGIQKFLNRRKMK